MVAVLELCLLPAKSAQAHHRSPRQKPIPVTISTAGTGQPPAFHRLPVALRGGPCPQGVSLHRRYADHLNGDFRLQSATFFVENP